MITDDEHTEHTVVARGLAIHVRRRRGSLAPPLLLLNGLGGSVTAWDPLLDHLPDRDVIMIDAPGTGRSETPCLPVRLPHLADLVLEAVRALGVTEVDVLGYSLGGTIAQEVAHRHPSMVRKLILTATTFGIGAMPVRFKAHRSLLSTRRYHDRTVMEREMALLAGGRTAREPAVLAGLLATRESHPPSTRGYYYQQLAVIAWSSWPWLHRLKCESMVLHGDADPVVPLVNARLIAWRLPHGHLEVVPGAGHLLLFDDAEHVGALIDAFLGSHGATRASVTR